jgi:1,4-dihydroxy-2-naphthoate octaprenyltransferase
MNGKLHQQILIWWRAFRYHFVPPSIFPATLGAAISWSVDKTFSTGIFFLVLLGVVVNHFALNMTDDYYDFKHAVDQQKPGEKNPYTGGSGTLSSGLITPYHMSMAFALCYGITTGIGIYLAWIKGWPILAFGLFGVFCSIFYTMPPISYSHHGLGELGLLVNFGTIIGLGSYFVQAHKFSLEAFLATLPMGIMLFSMIVINEIPDYETDKMAGKLTLVARYGKKVGTKIYIFSWICTYLVIIGAVALQLIPMLCVIALASVPLAYRSIEFLKHHYNSPTELAPANLDMIKAHSVTCIGLITAYGLQGLINGANALQLGMIILLLSGFYTPAVIPLLKKH